MKEKANESLQQATNAKTAFLANMSHGSLQYKSSLLISILIVQLKTELRTPMHGIIGIALNYTCLVRK